MRARRSMTFLAGAVLGVMTLGIAAPVVASGPSVRPAEVSGAVGFTLRSTKGKGLVTLEQTGASATLRFQLLGLKPNTGYRLVGSTKGCASSKGVLFNRSFTSNGKGTIWDPTTYQIDAGKVVSVRLINKATGAVATCSGFPEVPMNAEAVTAKLRSGTVRGLVAETEPEFGQWMVVATFSGLTPNGDYWLNGRTGTCASPDGYVWTRETNAFAAGNALERFYPTPQASTATIIELRLVSDVNDSEPAPVCVRIR